MHRVARHHGPARGKGSRAPVKFAGVARHDADVLNRRAQLLGHDLCKRGVVPLPLRADAHGHRNAPARLHRHLRALVGPNARALDVGHHADADVLALLAQPRLLGFDEIVVVDEVERFVQRGLVVARIVAQGGKVLVDDFVVVGKGVRRDEIFAADVDAVDLQLLRGQIEQPLHDKDAVLPPRAAVGGDDGFVGEDGAKFAVVVGHAILAEQCTLAVDGHSQAVGRVGPGVVQKFVVDAENLALPCQRHLRLVDLTALLRGRVEILLPILDPLDGSPQLHGQPGQQHLFGVEHHDLWPEAAADKGRDHAHLLFGQASAWPQCRCGWGWALGLYPTSSAARCWPPSAPRCRDFPAPLPCPGRSESGA